jgi:cytochrome P450
MNALSSSKECEDFIHAFTAAQRGVVTPAAAREDDWERCCDHVTNYIDERVTEALLRVSNEDENDSEKKRYVRVVDEMAKATKDKVALRFQVLSVFSPAHDTVAVTVGNLFFYLARHQSVWSKLRAELLPTASQPLTYQILNSYKYLNWTIRESTNTSASSLLH